jgi:hypothetical protein
MVRYHPWFPRTLKGADFQTLEDDPAAIFILSKKLKLIYFNPAWFTFAEINHGEPDISDHFPVGTKIADAMSEPFRDFYLNLYKEILKNNEVWEHDYECSSPEAYRVFHETAYPLPDLEGIMVVNSLLLEKEHTDTERASMPPIEEHYRLPSGLITQCSYCRRFQRSTAPAVWDWVPDWISHPPEKISHSLCRICFDYYFKHHHPSPSIELGGLSNKRGL